MFAGLIPGLNSIQLPAAREELYCQIPASWGGLLNLTGPCLTFIRRELSDSGVSRDFRTVLIWSSAGVMAIILMIASLMRSLYLKKKKKRTGGCCTGEPPITEVAGEWTKSDAKAIVPSSLCDAPSHENKGEIVPISDSDAKYTEEDLQVQEALLDSLRTSQMANNASSSTIPAIPKMNTKLVEIAKEVSEPSQSFCEICLENRENWQMFTYNTCSHSFCYDCTSKHIIAKIQDNTKTITCPGVNCNTMLDFNTCRLMIPKDILVSWDESLCNSLILESQKLYCPFRDCSTMLVNDSGVVVKEITCPMCKRSFCALCCVPWHSEFTCKEFGKLNAKKRGREDLMAATLAKKKHWRKCPRCKMYVERNEGCMHITCRCRYEFCYRCGSKWSSNHGGCRRRS